MTRGETLERLHTGTYDLLVIGGGIVGARVAYDAAAAGLRTALVDAGDFAGATSSASSNLIHGGFRYLANGHVRLVRRARLEQVALRSRVAPGLIRNLPIVLALDRDARFGPRAIRAGLRCYGALSGFRSRGGRGLSQDEALARVPDLDTSNLTGCVLLEEAQTHGARLTLATIRAAARREAVVSNYVRVAAFESARGRLVGAALEDSRTGEVLNLRFRAAVNATGPWLDRVRALAYPGARPLTRLSKGVHATFPLPAGWSSGLAVSLSANRASFVLPWHGVLLAGVTDTLYDGDPGAVRPTSADVDAVVRGLESVLRLEAGTALHAFAGLRVLPAGPGESHNAARQPVVEAAANGLVSVAGGKLTTHRWIAAAALARLPPELRPRSTANGAVVPRGRGDTPALQELDAATRAHLVSLYGAEAETVARIALEEPGGAEPIHAGAPDIRAQERYAFEQEWAVTGEDVGRRTTLGARGLCGGKPGAEVQAAPVPARPAVS